MKTPDPAFVLVCVERCGNALPIPFGKANGSWLSKRKWDDSIQNLTGRLAASGWLMSVMNKENGWIGPLCPECAPKVYRPEVLEVAKDKTKLVGDPIQTVKLIKTPPLDSDVGDPDYF